MNCLRGCPTETIRVRDGKAAIIAERCIDCGEYIRACPYHAKVARTDPLSSLDRFRYDRGPKCRIIQQNRKVP